MGLKVAKTCRNLSKTAQNSLLTLVSELSTSVFTMSQAQKLLQDHASSGMMKVQSTDPKPVAMPTILEGLVGQV